MGQVTPTDPRLQLIADMAKVRPSHVHHVWHALSKLGDNFDAESFALFARLETRHVEAIMTALGGKDLLPQKKLRSARAGPLPADFILPDDWILWAREKRLWSERDAREEGDMFVDYWRGTGKGMTDWRSTWQNWVRRSSRPNGKISPHVRPATLVTRIEYLDRTIALYRKMGRGTEIPALERELDDLRSQSNVVPLRKVSDAAG